VPERELATIHPPTMAAIWSLDFGLAVAAARAGESTEVTVLEVITV
jgi:hypothetical protein